MSAKTARGIGPSRPPSDGTPPVSRGGAPGHSEPPANNRALANVAVRRISYLDGLRGIAALHVVLGHVLHCFAYDFTKYTAFGFLLNNGGVDVNIFFLLSGVVLTYATVDTPRALPQVMLRRIIRLGLPLLAATLLAVLMEQAGRGALLAAIPQVNTPSIAARLVPLSFVRAVQDATMFTVTGFSDTTLFRALVPYLPTQATTVNFPIWSLHIELWGSFLVFLLVAAASWNRLAYRLAILAMACTIGPFPLALFILGHLSAPLARDPRNRPLLGSACILAGIAVATASFIPGQYRIVDMLEPYMLLRPHNFFKLPTLLAAILIFYGVLFSAPARRLLTTRPVQFLGQQSFALYLVHAPVLFSLGVAAYLVGGTPLAFIATLAGALAIAALFERLIDRPAILLSRRITPR